MTLSESDKLIFGFLSEIGGLCESTIRTVGAANGAEIDVPVAQEVEGNVAGSSLRLDHARSCSTGPQKSLSGLL